MENLLTAELLSARIQKSIASIRSDATRNPRSLPPICRLPGTKRLLWRESDVEEWVAQFVDTSIKASRSEGIGPTGAVQPVKSQESKGKLRPGRPTKAQQVARLKTAEREARADEATAQHN